MPISDGQNMVKIKVCGMSDPALVRLCLESGVDFIGMIHHVPSPRHVDLAHMRELCGAIPKGKRVGVVVQPDIQLVEQLWETGVDVLQVHVKDLSPDYLGLLRTSLPSSQHQLWLAPKIAPNDHFPEGILEFSDAIVLDTYSKDKAGGTGLTGDWKGFQKIRTTYPNRHFILAGGLNAENIKSAIAETGTMFVDVNSGLESSPGVKSEEMIRAFFRVFVNKV